MRLPISSFILFLLAALFTTACNPSAADSGSGGIVVGKVDRNKSLREIKQKNDAELKGSISARMGEASAKRGQIACLPVEMSNVNQLIGLQYTMEFDSAALRFSSVRNFGMPQYKSDNFGTRFADRGVVSTLWHDGTLKGLTLPANTKVYEICFENLMPKGQSAEVRFKDGPTSIEVIRANMDQQRFTFANGTITSR